MINVANKYFYLLIIIAGILVSSIVSGQTFEWAKQGGGKSNDYGKSIAVDSAGNSYVTGYFQDTASFGNQILKSRGGEDIFVAKYNSDGSLAWIRQGGHQFHDDGYAITLDRWNNIYVTGIYDVFCILDQDTIFGGTMFVAKMDTSGNVAWLRSAQAHTPFGISTDSLGNCYITGDYYTRAYFGDDTLFSKGKADIFVVKYSSDGEVIWAKSAGGKETDYGHGITTDLKGNSFITGFIQDTATFGTYSTTSKGNSDIFISKLDSAGNFLWAKNIGDKMEDVGYGVVLDDKEETIFVTGSFSDTVSFGSTSLISSQPPDIFIVRCDTSGTIQWAKCAGGKGSDYGYSVDVDKNNNPYITGRSSDSAYFDTLLITRSIIAAKYSSTGNLLWIKDAGGSTGDEGRDIAVSSNSAVYLTGNFNSSAGIFDTVTLVSAGIDFYVAKLNDDVPTYTQQMLVPVKNKFILYPNPASDFIKIDLSEFSGEKIQLRIVNTLGQIVWREEVSGEMLLTIETANLVPGIYCITAGNSGLKNTFLKTNP